jgi:hypothetical protein
MRSPRRWQLAALICAITWLIYLLFPTRDYYWDGIAFALKVESSSRVSQYFQPNHLLYPLPFYPLWRGLGKLGIPVRALFLMAGVNKFLSALTASVIALTMLEWTGSRVLSAGIALAFAFSATWWKFSTDANAYIAPVLLLLLAFRILSRRPVSLRRSLAAGALHACAMLLHQLAFWFYFPALALISYRWWRQSVAYVGLTAAIVAPAYAAVYLRGDVPFRERGFLSWLTYHTDDAPFTFHLVTNLVQGLQSNVKLLFGGKLGSIQSIGSVLFGCFVLAAAVLVAWRVPAREPVRDDRTRRIALLLWIAPYLLFFIVWRPQDTFHRLFYIVPVWLLAGLELARRGTRPRVIAGFAGLLFCANFIFFIYPQSKASNKASVAFALQQRERWPRGTGVVYRDFHTDLWTIAYFSPQVTWLDLPSSEVLDRYRRQCRNLWLEATAYDYLGRDPAGRAWLQCHRLEPLAYRLGHQSFRFYRVLD